MALVRVLVVEDHEQFRGFICSTLEKAPELQVVGIVSDGLAAVQKAEELRPDLILLDIGLPNAEWNRSRPTHPRALPRNQDTFCKPGIFG